jgi:hypothetical protein
VSSHPPPQPRSLIAQLPSISENYGSHSDAAIQADFFDLYQSTLAHVHKFYTSETAQIIIPQAMVEHATLGAAIPSRQVQFLLEDGKSRQGLLALCIGRTILSRCLLLRVGVGGSPGATFLPPEIVECFQSFSIGHGLIGVEVDENPKGKFSFYDRLVKYMDLR